MVFKVKVVYSLQRHLVAGRSNGFVAPILLSLLSVEINQKLFVGKSSGEGKAPRGRHSMHSSRGYLEKVRGVNWYLWFMP